MTSSFQSTAFRSAANPVDTFVAPPRVLPKTGAEELASVLQAVNPNLQKFIGWMRLVFASLIPAMMYIIILPLNFIPEI